jgi:release factor glutamine methyltransferase
MMTRTLEAPEVKRLWTILDIITWGKDYFLRKGVDSPRLTIELLLSHVLDVPRIKLYTLFDRPLSKPELTTLHELVKRRAAREPLQYITGEAYFYDLVLKVSPDVLIPRPETELLADAAIQRARTKKLPLGTPVLDIGTGTGCIALTLAKHIPEANIYAIDYSEVALGLARENAERLNLKHVRFAALDILQPGALESLPEEFPKQFAMIVSNPPYIPKRDMAELAPEVARYEPRTALTDDADGLTFYRRFAELFPTILAEGGVFFLEIGFGQSDEVTKIFADAGFRVRFEKDLSGIPRVCVGRRA